MTAGTGVAAEAPAGSIRVATIGVPSEDVTTMSSSILTASWARPGLARVITKRADAVSRVTRRAMRGSFDASRPRPFRSGRGRCPRIRRAVPELPGPLPGVLVEPPGQVEALQGELDGRGRRPGALLLDPQPSQEPGQARQLTE